MASPSADDRELVRQLRAERDRLGRHLEEAQAAMRRQQETIDRLVAQQENWQVLLRDAQAELRSLHAPARPARLGTIPEGPADQSGELPAEGEPTTSDQSSTAAAEGPDRPELPVEAAASVDEQAAAAGSTWVATADVEPSANATDSPAVPAAKEAAAVAAEEGEAAAEREGAMASPVANEEAGEADAPGEPSVAEWLGLAAWAPGNSRRPRRTRQRRSRR